jgi:hypothetical protein
MRCPISPVSFGAASAACLLALGWSSAARAADTAGPLDRFAAAWMGVVGVIGATEEPGDEVELTQSAADAENENDFAIDDEGDEDRRPHREHRDSEWAEGGRRHHRGGHPHGGPHGHGPHHPGMGPGHMGPPPGPDGHHHAMRAFHEIIRRLGRIEEKLGIESGPPSGPEGDRPRRPRPEMQRPRGPRGDGGRPLDRLDLPEDVRRQMEERMQAGRRRMEEAKERMEQARQKFQAMEERLRQLEAEVERLKAAK